MADVEFKLTDEERKKQKELEGKHGVACHLIRGAGVDSWTKEPSFADVECFMDNNADPRKRGSALLLLLQSNLAEGTKESVFGKRPGAMVAHAGAYAQAVGLSADALLGK
ncbi:hypothetical protein [Sorangium sp. So ce388]|uniref:hypothetical protein n=1 Tax=Sorangium sp. So ce388 TaxID=3133309 RepID=UPI003F5BD691